MNMQAPKRFTEDAAEAPAPRLDQAAPARPAPEAVEAAPEAPPVPRRSGRRRLILLAIVAAVIAAGSYYGHRWWTTGRFMVSTDDAYVRADVTNLAAKVAGYVTDIHVADNAAVKAGDLILTVDPGDYRLALDAARTRADTQRATVSRFDAQIAAQRATVAQVQAQVAAAEADAKRAALDFDRYARLGPGQVVSQQRIEQAQADRDRTAAALQAAQAQAAGARAQLDVLGAQKVEAERALAEQLTQVARAERDLSFTEVRAPADGVFGNRGVQVGAYVQPGTRLGALVQTASLYVEANFKETQLAGLKAGQEVQVAVDALPGQAITGTVESFAPGSGSVFSLLPPENATGNFTKIVQRVPVRVRLPRDERLQAALRPGLSVVAEVDLRTGGDAPADRPGSAPAVATSAR